MVELCRCWRGSLQKGLQADAETHQEKKKERKRRRSTRNDLGRGPAPPSTTRLPSPGLDPTQKQSTPCPVPTGQCGGRGGCAGTLAHLLPSALRSEPPLPPRKASRINMSTGRVRGGVCVLQTQRRSFKTHCSGCSELSSHCRLNDSFMLLISAKLTNTSLFTQGGNRRVSSSRPVQDTPGL